MTASAAESSPLLPPARPAAAAGPGAVATAASGATATVAVEPAGPVAAAPSPVAASEPRRRRAQHVVAVIAITVAATGVYALLGLTRLSLFRATSLDLTLFDQVVRGFAALSAPTSPLRGVDLGKGFGFNQMGEHFSPILAVLAPLYWIHDGPETLIVAQAVLFALAVPPIWVFTRRVLGVGPAYLVVVAYAVSWPVARAANFDFHEVAFAPLLTAVMIERFHAGRHAGTAFAAAALLLVKEDMGLMVAGFGLFAALRGRRWDGVAYAAAGLLYTVLARQVFIPAVGGDPDMYWAYDQIGRTPGAIVGTLFGDPLHVLSMLVSPQVKIDTWAFLLWPALFTCLLSPLTLMAVPQILERVLSDRWMWWGTEYHHSAFTVAVLLCAGVDGAARLVRWLRRRNAPVDPRTAGGAWALGVCVVALTLVPRFPFDQLIRPEFYERHPDVVAAEQAIREVPDGVVVEAVNHIGPRLSGRDTVLLWNDRPPVAQWIVADEARGAYPWPSPDRQRERVEELKAMGYEVVFDREGYVVLHRTDPPVTPAM
ncbi:DUF2079 domain-containing protein [Microbispora sp. ATCC PTA-5024]|uniref:DUF2079 domain-containing protein n=1 Tax=Microbispora sp. ATCC PTA-5024 TaxID=316330 RepID=UPI0003DD22F6|nr:DUF2079 domain-containing protein [Microbispora sp. ATCC PTA-5024]ETK31600.1 hypothetical protein MPTA5024_33895 [Microbispora sp. ATCC PTA-5024]